MAALLSQAFLLGLAMGPACLGYCAPVCVPYLAAEQRENWMASARILSLFLGGRLIGYTLFGVGIGFVGSGLLRSASPAVWGTVRLATGLMLLAFGVLSRSPGFKWCPKIPASPRSRLFAAVLGLLSGVNLCPPFAAAIAGAAATRSVAQSVVYFWAFFAGTTVCFAPLVLVGRFSRLVEFRQVARVCLFLVGAWLTLDGAIRILGS